MNPNPLGSPVPRTVAHLGPFRAYFYVLIFIMNTIPLPSAVPRT